MRSADWRNLLHLHAIDCLLRLLPFSLDFQYVVGQLRDRTRVVGFVLADLHLDREFVAVELVAPLDLEFIPCDVQLAVLGELEDEFCVLLFPFADEFLAVDLLVFLVVGARRGQREDHRHRAAENRSHVFLSSLGAPVWRPVPPELTS